MRSGSLAWGRERAAPPPYESAPPPASPQDREGESTLLAEVSMRMSCAPGLSSVMSGRLCAAILPLRMMTSASETCSTSDSTCRSVHPRRSRCGSTRFQTVWYLRGASAGSGRR